MTLRLMVGIATAGHNKTGFTRSLVAMQGRLTHTRLLPEVERQEVHFEWAESSSIGRNRHQLVRRAQAVEATHLLFLDEDVGFRPELAETLLRRRQWCVGASYPRRAGPPFDQAGTTLGGRRIWVDEHTTGIEPVKVLPQGCTLIEMSIFERVPPPWFVLAYLPGTPEREETYSTEDSFFFQRVWDETGLRPFVDHEASRLITHIGDYAYSWRDVVRDPAPGSYPDIGAA
jgi:hypothetical protein